MHAAIGHAAGPTICKASSAAAPAAHPPDTTGVASPASIRIQGQRRTCTHTLNTTPKHTPLLTRNNGCGQPRKQHDPGPAAEPPGATLSQIPVSGRLQQLWHQTVAG